MLLVALAQLRRQLGRTLALLLAVAVATTSFTVLTGAAESTRLQVRGTVQQNFRSSYDLLVRPASSYTELERTQQLVRPNYQSGIFGGITTAQLAAIRAVTGVEVAAPVANLGYAHFGGAVEVPVSTYLNGDAQQLFRITPTWTMDRGTSRFVGTPLYVYVSTHRTVVLKDVPYTRDGGNYRGLPTYAEVMPGRGKPVPGRPACPAGGAHPSAIPRRGLLSDPGHGRAVTSIAAQEAHAEPGRTLNDPRLHTLGPFDQVALWGNLGVSLLGPTAALFVLAPMGAPMSLVAAFTAVIVGTIVGTLPVSMIALAGARTDSPSMVLLRGLFGRRVSYAPTVLNLIQCLGWASSSWW